MRTVVVSRLSLVLAVGLTAFPAAARSPSGPLQVGSTVQLESDGRTLEISLNCPRFVFAARELGTSIPPAGIKGSLASGRQLEVSYPLLALTDAGQLEARLLLEWSAREAVLRKWTEFRLLDAPAPALLKEIVLEDLAADKRQAQFQGGGPQSYPVFLEGFFAGIEFPIAATRLEGGRLLVSHRPGWLLANGQWRRSRTAVFGVAARGAEREAFQRYIGGHRPNPRGLHFNYNSWWTAPSPFYRESDILWIMRHFETNLHRPYGVALDTLCIDMGWANPRSVWEIDRTLFPDGFTKVQAGARGLNANLGLWISPTSCYPDALSPEWARTNGIETFTGPAGQLRMCCLGGAHYAAAFRQRLVDMVRRYSIRQVKLDGYALECPESDHGHAPGPLSSESLTEGGLAAFAAVRQVAPEVWLEATCFGWNPSPWWLFHVNSVIGTFGDDAPFGRVPAPIYRESYTTARDYFNLQGAARLPIPILAQEVLGIIHQSQEPFQNDAVMTLLRGHAFVPLYINPAFMDAKRWESLASILQWARRNAAVLAETKPVLPRAWCDGRVPEFSNNAVMPREPYGYAHWRRGRGVVGLRNPWIAPTRLALRLDETLGAAPDATNLGVVSLYPEPRLYASRVSYGDTLQVPLAPCETVVLSFVGDRLPKSLPRAVNALADWLEVRKLTEDIKRLEFEPPGQTMGRDWTSLMPEAAFAFQLRLEAEVTVRCPAARILVLTEGGQPVFEPVRAVLRIDGRVTPMTANSSEAGWAASGQPRQEHWLFLQAALAEGTHRVALELLTDDGLTSLSAWVWATRAGGERSTLPNALPPPEIISLDAQSLLNLADLKSLTSAVRQSRPLEKIDGVFLDALEPASSTQGWGQLQRNRSVWEKPLTIGGRLFRRGLGMHADARVTYDLGGRYRRFQSWVGADGASRATITFEVWGDGRTLWESGLMKRDTVARFVDVHVSGVKSLQLVVGHGGDNITSDHADWAEARLLY